MGVFRKICLTEEFFPVAWWCLLMETGWWCCWVSATEAYQLGRHSVFLSVFHAVFKLATLVLLPLLLLMKTSPKWQDRVHRELDCKCLDPFTFNSVILLKVPVINKLTSRSRHLQRAVLPTGFLFFPVRKDICCPKNILVQTSWAYGALLCKTLSSVHGFSEHHWASLLLHSACSAVTCPHGNERAAT